MTTQAAPPQGARSKPTYSRLTPGARAEISWSGLAIADYIRAWDPDGQWSGDRCGCPDDRCRDGYHHDIDEDCGCLAALLADWVRTGMLGGRPVARRADA